MLLCFLIIFNVSYTQLNIITQENEISIFRKTIQSRWKKLRF